MGRWDSKSGPKFTNTLCKCISVVMKKMLPVVMVQRGNQSRNYWWEIILHKSHTSEHLASRGTDSICYRLHFLERAGFHFFLFVFFTVQHDKSNVSILWDKGQADLLLIWVLKLGILQLWYKLTACSGFTWAFLIHSCGTCAASGSSAYVILMLLAVLCVIYFFDSDSIIVCLQPAFMKMSA